MFEILYLYELGILEKYPHSRFFLLKLQIFYETRVKVFRQKSILLDALFGYGLENELSKFLSESKQTSNGIFSHVLCYYKYAEKGNRIAII